MRKDSIGIFWEDLPKVKEKKVVEKRQPPVPVWLNDDYLPNLNEALSKQYNVFTENELMSFLQSGGLLLLDIESYGNYFLIGFKSYNGDKIFTFELTNPHDSLPEYERNMLNWMMCNFNTCGFNSLSFDNTLIMLAIEGCTCTQLKHASNLMIEYNMSSFMVLKQFKIDSKNYRFLKHIDLMHVAPRKASLKKYSGRLHIKRIQDLPFAPDKELSTQQKAIIKWYWENDMQSTELLCSALNQEIKLRFDMGKNYGLNFLCRSDPQIAQDIFVEAAKKAKNVAFLQKPILSKYVGTSFKYSLPHYISFKSQLMQSALNIITSTDFIIDEKGKVCNPNVLGMKVKISNSVYTLGLGGLHSNEKSRCFESKDGYILKDHDVTSYYPNLILTLGMYPESIGQVFLDVYAKIKNDRVIAKRNNDHVVNQSLKIVINGSFGKFGDVYSYLYAPNLLIQTTITGQLCLLMLIETLEINGISVVSANTDGLVTYSHESQNDLMNKILKEWEETTQLELEHVTYKGLYSRDVNNYFAITDKGKIKGKGIYTLSNIQIDPKNEICAMSVMNFIAKGIPIEETVMNCQDFTKFITLQAVTGGAVKDGEYLGKVVRFYHSNTVQGEIIYAKSGNKVPKSDNCRPCMVLPSTFPDDVDFQYYIDEAYSMLSEIGYNLFN